MHKINICPSTQYPEYLQQSVKLKGQKRLNSKYPQFKLIPLLIILALIFTTFTSGVVLAEGAKTCDGPFAPVNALPYTDSGDTSNATTDNISTYPESLLEGFYANDLVYKIVLGEGNNVAFMVTGIPDVTDLAIFLVTDCTDGATWVATSMDSIDDANPEVISLFSYPAGTYYLLIDSYASEPGYPRYGAYTLEIIGSLGDVPSELVSNGGFEANDTPLRAPVLDPWVLKNAAGDKIKCNTDTKVLAGTGQCAFQLKGGAGENTRLQQTIDISALTLAAGDTLDLSALVNGKKATASGKISLKVKYNDATPAQKATVALGQTSGYSERAADTLTLAGADVSKIKLVVKHTSPKGKVLLDDVSVKYDSVGLPGIAAPQVLPLPGLYRAK